MAFSISVISILRIAKAQYKIVMQDIIFKIKVLRVTHKSMKSVKFSPSNIKAIQYIISHWYYHFQYISYSVTDY